MVLIVRCGSWWQHVSKRTTRHGKDEWRRRLARKRRYVITQRYACYAQCIMHLHISIMNIILCRTEKEHGVYGVIYRSAGWVVCENAFGTTNIIHRVVRDPLVRSQVSIGFLTFVMNKQGWEKERERRRRIHVCVYITPCHVNGLNTRKTKSKIDIMFFGINRHCVLSR
jgi:hypothetical protein